MGEKQEEIECCLKKLTVQTDGLTFQEQQTTEDYQYENMSPASLDLLTLRQ